MSGRTSIATVVILAAGLFTGEVRADCLDGQAQVGAIQGSVDTRWHDGNFVVCRDYDSLSAPGTVSVSACPLPKLGGIATSRLTISTGSGTASISAALDAQTEDYFAAQGMFWFARADARVELQAVGGDILVNPVGSMSRVQDGQVFPQDLFAFSVLEGETKTFWFTCIAVAMSSDSANQCSVTLTATPFAPTSPTRTWINPAGGSYSDAANWDPQCPPVHDTQRSDIASFALASGPFIPVSDSGATAWQWRVNNLCSIAFSGSGQVFSTSATDPSLSISNSGQLRLASGASLDSVHASVGASGATNSVLEVKGGRWTNTESALIGRGSVDVLEGGTASTKELWIGSGNGPGTVHVTGDASSFEVTDVFVVGDTTAGTLEIDKGLFHVTPVTLTPQIGKSAPGTVTVRGDDSSFSSYGRFQVDNSLVVGNGASGRLNIERGGHVSIDPDLEVNHGANAAGEVVVDGQGGDSVLDVFGGTFVNATELQEVLVQNGGRLSTTDLFIGGLQIRPGIADVTIRGRSGSFPTLTVGPAGGGGSGTFVGDGVPGQLNVEFGALAELNNGLHVGELAQGIVSVSRRELPPGTYAARLKVTGETQVGIGALGVVQLDEDASMETNGDLLIGLGTGNPSGTVNVYGGSHLVIHGTLSVGEAGIGLLNIVDEPNMFPSHVFCDNLVVGGNTPTATGIIVLSFVPNVPVSPHFSHLTVHGSTQVGVGLGRGEIVLADPSGRLEINGTMTIGNPAGGPGGGAVTLVDATIDGTGNIVVNRNGSLIGTGTVTVPHIAAGGIISPGLSPGTLTIDGDLDILPGGVLIIEYAGLNPGEFDVLHVTGQTALGGRLEVHFRGGFSPDDPAAFVQSQPFVEADQGITGDYDERVYAFPDLFADFDDDGDKDLSDLAAFQNCFGLSGGELEPACGRADWENDGVIGVREIQEMSARLSGPQ